MSLRKVQIVLEMEVEERAMESEDKALARCEEVIKAVLMQPPVEDDLRILRGVVVNDVWARG